MLNNELCHPNMPRSSDAYFENFNAEALALICEATRLGSKIRRTVPIECGILWAAIRLIETGDANCPCLKGISSASAEASFTKWFRREPDDMDETEIEFYQSYNAPALLPFKLAPGEAGIDWKSEVTGASLLAAIIDQFNFETVASMTLNENGIDERRCYEALLVPGAFRANRYLQERGMFFKRNRTLYDTCNSLAQVVGSWLITSPIAALAAHKTGKVAFAQAPPAVERDWKRVVEHAADHVQSTHCAFLMSFPGPRPWSYRALSVQLADNRHPTCWLDNRSTQ